MSARRWSARPAAWGRGRPGSRDWGDLPRALVRTPGGADHCPRPGSAASSCRRPGLRGPTPACAPSPPPPGRLPCSLPEPARGGQLRGSGPPGQRSVRGFVTTRHSPKAPLCWAPVPARWPRGPAGGPAAAPSEQAPLLWPGMLSSRFLSRHVSPAHLFVRLGVVHSAPWSVASAHLPSRISELFFLLAGRRPPRAPSRDTPRPADLLPVVTPSLPHH